MNVENNGWGYKVEMSAEEAARLASVLGLVADRSAAQSIDNLYNKLLSAGVSDAGLAFFEKNEDIEAIEEFGQPEHFVVVL